MNGSGAWQPMHTAPKDGAVLCLSDGSAMVAGVWDGTGWTVFPEEEQAGVVDPCGFEPRFWMRVRFAGDLPRSVPDDIPFG